MSLPRGGLVPFVGRPKQTAPRGNGSNGGTSSGSGSTLYSNSPTIDSPTITGHETIEGVMSTGATGTGKFVFDTSPVIATPTISGHPVIEGVTPTGATGTGKLVFDTSPTLVTPVLGVVTATSITLSGGTALSAYLEGTYTPVVTLVGGAGNTVPVYTVNSGRYTRIGNHCFTEVHLYGDGGAEGAGTGRINVSLPVTASASISGSNQPVSFGTAFNNASYYGLQGLIAGSATTILFWYLSGTTLSDFTGDLQNNTNRSFHIQFWYEV